MEDKSQTESFSPKETILEQFAEFATTPKTGFYNSCCITSIFITSGKGKWYRNVFTVAVFEETPFKNYNLRYHSPHLFDISKELSIGIVSQRVTIADAISLYETAYRSGTWQQPGCPELVIEKLTPLPPQFVPLSATVPVRHILKNSYRYPQYMFEMFCEKKEFYLNLNPRYYQGGTSAAEKRIYNLVESYLPVDLRFITDRWGNVVFQFPVNLLKVSARGTRDGKDLLVAMKWHPRLRNGPRRDVHIKGEVLYDGLILGNALVTTSTEVSMEQLRLGTTEGEINLQIYSRDYMLYKSTFNLINHIKIDFSIASGEPVTICVPASGKHEKGFTYEVQPVSSAQTMNIGKTSEWRDWVWTRTNLESKRQLERRLEFVQYGVHGRNEREKALQDLRRLIEWHGDKGVYLWDPYAEAHDIWATLFACSMIQAPLQVITSYSKKRRKLASQQGLEISGYEDWLASFKRDLSEAVKQRKVNLQVRCQRDQYGWQFHDRFLLFPGREPKVWSLGCSLNSIGRQHSILMKVSHAQPVIDAFEDLWEELEQCLVWP